MWLRCCSGPTAAVLLIPLKEVSSGVGLVGNEELRRIETGLRKEGMGDMATNSLTAAAASDRAAPSDTLPHPHPRRFFRSSTSIEHAGRTQTHLTQKEKKLKIKIFFAGPPSYLYGRLRKAVQKAAEEANERKKK